MTNSKTNVLSRLLGCFTATPTTTTPTPTTKKRLSTSLRDDNPFDSSPPSPSTTSSDSSSTTTTTISHFIPPRLSLSKPTPPKSVVTCTFFGHRGGSHVWWCVQLNRFSPKPSLLLHLSLPTRTLVQEMQSGLLRIAFQSNNPDFNSLPLQSIPLWTLFCNARRVGFATRRKPTQETREMLKKMQSITIGAGGVVAETEGNPELREELMYMKANYEWIIGGPNSESFHLVSPDDGPDQDLSLFLLRSV